jgi:hypothetical protein
MTTITSGVSMSAYVSEICFPSCLTLRAIRVALIIGLPVAGASALDPETFTGIGLVSTPGM